MELNTINKTGTWSETADRINSNFSKISIEVEEIKQNGGGGSGGGGDVTNADHATSAYTLDKNTPVQTLNFREEGYIPDVHYDYYDSLSYNGSMWACINEDGSSSVPGSNGDWLEIASKGDKGDGYTQMGQFKTGMVVPKMGVVSMGGGSYVAKASTTNPPLWCWTDNAGNRFTFADGGYVLTGEVNTTEYDVWSEKGDTGAKGDKGDKGDDGEKGDKGDKGDQGVQGIQGCIFRESEWSASSVQYRNDEALTSGTRYIDFALIRNDAAIDGWDVYKCLKTHVSSASNKPGNTTYWEKLSGVGPIYTSLIISKNASLAFVQGNELLIKDANNNVVAGLTGGSSKEAGTTPVRIWAGGSVPGSAPYRVNELGEFVSTKANVTGIITATLFYSPGSDMDSLADSEGNMTVNPSTQGSTFFSADGLGGTITLPPASSWNGLKLEFVVDMTSRVAKNPDKYKATNYFCGLAGSYNNKTEIQMARPYVLEMKAFNNHWYITRMDLIE